MTVTGQVIGVGDPRPAELRVGDGAIVESDGRVVATLDGHARVVDGVVTVTRVARPRGRRDRVERRAVEPRLDRGHGLGRGRAASGRSARSWSATPCGARRSRPATRSTSAGRRSTRPCAIGHTHSAHGGAARAHRRRWRATSGGVQQRHGPADRGDAGRRPRPASAAHARDGAGARRARAGAADPAPPWPRPTATAAAFPTTCCRRCAPRRRTSRRSASAGCRSRGSAASPRRSTHETTRLARADRRAADVHRVAAAEVHRRHGRHGWS